VGGLLAEVLKLVIRRERPGPHDGEWVFRAFLDNPWSTKALGLPSSHAMTAFAGAAMASYLFPRTAPVWIAWAVACAWTRVAVQAHFLSDVALAAIAGWLVARTLFVLVARRDTARQAG
jgi:undecaprenyl-diphosphatase